MRKKLYLLLCFFLIPSLALCGTALAKRLWSKTQPQINLTHIFKGEINRHGKPTGFHSRPGGADPEGARIKKIMSRPNAAGVYTARVEIWDARQRLWKEKFSSFSPIK